MACQQVIISENASSESVPALAVVITNVVAFVAAAVAVAVVPAAPVFAATRIAHPLKSAVVVTV